MARHPNALKPIQLDRAAGVLVAAAAGDALGAGYEFGSPCPANEVQMLRGALTGRAAGSWTDDTDMAMAIARVAGTGARLEDHAGRAAVATGFAEWYASHPPDIGNQTRAVLSAASSGVAMAGAMEAAAAAYQERHRDAAGNGSLMRTGPVALTAIGDDERLLASASAISALTHPHLWARQACQLWCVAIDRAIREGRLDGLTDGLALIEPKGYGYWHDAVAQAETIPIETLRRTNGFVVAALQSAWRAIVSTDDLKGPAHLEAALQAAVAIGGDTDTVAAIAGALLGARYGASAVPFAWRRHLGGWPTDLAHGDLAPLAILAANGGKADPAGWPLEDDLMPYYERTNHPIGLVGTLPGHEGVLWGDVGGLAQAEAEAFVSLCRIGPGQRRGKEHHEVWLQDNSTNAYPAFVLSDTADAIEQLRRDLGSVFVHCVRSESRTPTVAAAWLLRHRGMDLDGATDLVRKSLPNAFTNHNRDLIAALQSVQPARVTFRTSKRDV
jgi:ADP-ribosyl-[dinitrogen reductase] hydrolase